MPKQKLNWTLMLLLLSSLILGLTACSGQNESKAPPATIAEEKAAEGAEVEAPAPTEETTTVTEPTAEETEAEAPTPTEEAVTYEVDTEAPTVVSTTPPNGSQDVSPDITEISVTFSEAMMDKNWSWAYEQQDKFPQITGDPSYDASFTINTLPVELEPNKEYEIWINTSQFKNFTDKAGNPATPYKLMFKTKEAAAAEEGEDTTVDNLPDVSAFTINDWPIPPEAEEVEFIIGGELTYDIAWEMETVVNFYRPTFEYLGLETDCLDDVGHYTSISCSVLQNNLVVNFSLHKANDKSVIQIDFHNYALEDDSAATETGAEIADVYNVGDIIEMGNLSLVVNEVTSPAETGYQPDEGNKFLKIVFTIENKHSSAKIDAFSLRMTIKDPAEKSYYSEGMGFMDVDDTGDLFGSHTGRVAPTEKARGGINFQVPVDVTELVLLIDATELGGGEALVALPDTEAPQMDDSVPDASAANIPDFLIPADAQDLNYDADFGFIGYTSPSDVETVVEFYRQSLLAEGWQEDEDFSSVDENSAFVEFDQGEDTLYINIIAYDDITEVSVDVSFAWSLVGIVESGEDTASDSGPLRLVEVDEFPVPSDNTHWQPEDWQSELRKAAAFASPSDIDALVELYETELPKQGWEFIEHNLDSSEAHLYFEGDGQEFFVDLRVEGALTAVELIIRNPAAAAEVGMVMPSSGQGRIYIGNIMEVEVVVTVAGQNITVPPSEMMETLDEIENIELSPGVYTITSDIPDFGEVGEEVEVSAGEVWTIMVMPGGLLVIQAY